jgi:hypothetical protein
LMNWADPNTMNIITVLLEEMCQRWSLGLIR